MLPMMPNIAPIVAQQAAISAMQTTLMITQQANQEALDAQRRRLRREEIERERRRNYDGDISPYWNL